MTRHLAAFLAATAIAACSSNPQAAVEPAGSTTAIAQDMPALPPPAESIPFAPAAPLDGEPLPVAPDPSPGTRLVAPQQRLASACGVLVERTRGRIVLTAVADLDRPMSGDYSFVITKSGGGNSSDIEQGGPFGSKGAGPIELSSSEISLERGSSYRATLILTSQGREVCRRTVRS